MPRIAEAFGRYAHHVRQALHNKPQLVCQRASTEKFGGADGERLPAAQFVAGMEIKTTESQG